MHVLLDKDYQACLPEGAAFLSESTERNRQETKPERNQNVWFYNEVYGEIAEKSSQKEKPDPVGPGSPGQEKELEGFRFHWTEEARWVCERQNCRIVLPPETDTADAQLMLKAIAPIEEKILARSLIGREPIQFLLGAPQWDRERKALAAATDFMGKHVRFFWAENGSHLLGSRLEVAAQLPLKNLILHELAHLLEPLLEQNLREIEQTLTQIWPSAGKAFKEISPHYLFPQTQKIGECANALEQAIGKRREFVLVNGQKTRTLPHKIAWSHTAAQEILAEVVRFHYLEPCLTGNVPPENPCGWEALDNLAHRLQREAKISLQKEGSPKELFPRNRAEKQPGLVEKIQDWPD